MKTKFLIPLICITISAFTVQAQNNEDVTTRKFYFDFGGAIGVFIPFDQASDQKTLVGSNAMTYLQVNYHQNYFAKLQFGQTTVDFKSQTSFGALNSFVSAKANSTNLGMSFGYQRSFGKWQPFILGGAGASFIDVPASSFDAKTNTINHTTSSATNLYINAGAGVNFKISNSFIIFTEAQGSTIPDLPKNSNTHLSGISALIGIKATL